MSPTYNEEELLLRLLVGVVFPVLILVVLRLTRFGLRRWEKRWRSEASRWLDGLFSRAGFPNSSAKSRKTVAALLGLERAVIASGAVVLLSVAWFVLFPQTRPIAQEFVQGILAPVLGLAGKILQGLLLLLYSAGLFLLAFLANRYLSRRVREKHPNSFLALPLFSAPLRICVWLFAAFLFLLPYPGMPRTFAVGLLCLALLLVILASRPLIEEIALGAYLHSSVGLEKGEAFKMEGKVYTVVDLKPLHALLEKEGEVLYVPYSRIMKATIAKGEDGTHGEP